MRTIQMMMIVLVFTAMGCKEKEKAVSLSSREWELSEITPIQSSALPEKMPTLQFTDSTAFYGFAGCNRFFGKYSVGEGNIMQIVPGGATMMFCPDMEFEDWYMKALGKVAKYTIAENKLQLIDSAGVVTLTFVWKDTAKLVGVAEDSHGCNATAGYTWSEVQQSCIRIFESGIQLVSIADKDASLAAYAVFSTDSSKVELFIPNEDVHPVLDRKGLPNGGYAWNIEDDDTFNLRMQDGKWILERRGEIVYGQAEK